MKLTPDARALGGAMLLALVDLAGCGETGGSGGPGASATTGATAGAGATSSVAGPSTGGPSTTGSGTTGSSVASGGAGGSGGTQSAGGAGGVPESGVSSVEEMCATYPAAWGAYMARCHGGDAEEWQGTIQAPCGSATQSESQGRIRLNVENAAACLEALAHQGCSGPSPSACSDLFTGTVPAEGTCHRLELWGRGDECEAGTFCNAEVLGGCTSTCSPYLQLGERCTGQFVSTPCAPGTECDPSDGCIVPADEGEECSENSDCKSYYCVVPDAGAPGTCQDTEIEGPCTASIQCGAGLGCIGDSGQRRCALRKPVGAPCTFGWYECVGQCSLDGQCEIAADEGEACGTQHDPVTALPENLACAGGLYCNLDDQRCHRVLEPGDACRSSNSECAGAGDRVANCDEGNCTTCE